MRLIPAAGPPEGGRGWTLGASVLLHVAAVLALLLVVRRPDPDGGVAPSYELVFDSLPGVPDGPPDQAPPPPAPAPREDALPGPVSPPALAPPEPDATPTPPAPAPSAAPAPEPTPPPPPSEAAVPDTPAPPPQVRVTPPDLPAPAAPLVPDLVMPTPPPIAAPPRPAPARPAPPPRPRMAPPPSLGSLSSPMELSFGPAPQRPAAPRMVAPAGSVASRSLDLTPGPPKPVTRQAALSRGDIDFDARAAALGADWMDGVRAFWLRHRYYPRQAAENGEDGTVELELTVNRLGKVQSAVVRGRSGSSWLDMAAVGTFRSAQLPPLPPEVGESRTVTIPIHYILLRR